MIQTLTAGEFRQRLAGLYAPEAKFDEAELAEFKRLGVDLALALRGVFGGALDRKTMWERISNGIPVAMAKSGGKADRFIAAMLDYVKAEANPVVGSDALRAIVAEVGAMSPEGQRQFIRTCTEYRMLICLEARAAVQEAKGAESASAANLAGERAYAIDSMVAGEVTA